MKTHAIKSHFCIPHWTLVLTALLLAGCQSGGKKAPTEAVDFEERIQGIVFFLQQNEYELAQNEILTAMQEAESPEQWDILRRALITLPQELAEPLIQKALDMPYIQSSAAELFGFSKVYMHYKNYPRTIELVDQAIALEPREGYLFWRARVLAIGDRVPDAIGQFQRLIEQYPDVDEYKYQYAIILHNTGKNMVAESRKILESLPVNFTALYQRIIMAFQDDDDDRAEELYLQAHDILDLTDDERFQLGEVAWWLDRNDEAVDLFEGVSGGDNYYQARLMLARALSATGNDERAVVILRQVQNASAELAVSAYVVEANIRMQAEDYDQGLQGLSDALMLFKDDADLLYARAMILERMDRLDPMEADLKRIMELYPDNADAWNAWGYTLADRNLRLDEAEMHLQKAIELDDDNPAIIDSMAWLRFRQGRLDESAQLIRKAMSLSLDDPELYKHAIEIMQTVGESDEQQRLLDKARELFPDNDFFK